MLIPKQIEGSIKILFVYTVEYTETSHNWKKFFFLLKRLENV